MAVEDSSIRAHPSVALTIPYTATTVVSLDRQLMHTETDNERESETERETERWEGGQSVTGPSFRLLGPLVMISRGAENTDRMLHQTLPCSPFLPPCVLSLTFPPNLSVSISLK